MIYHFYISPRCVNFRQFRTQLTSIIWLRVNFFVFPLLSQIQTAQHICGDNRPFWNVLVTSLTETTKFITLLIMFFLECFLFSIGFIKYFLRSSLKLYKVLDWFEIYNNWADSKYVTGPASTDRSRSNGIINETDCAGENSLDPRIVFVVPQD